MKNLIKVENVKFSYGKSRTILEDMNFELNSGEILCLFGPNGCGKTTMIECALGLLETNEGNIYIDGRDIKKMSDRDIAQVMTLVPQFHESTFGYTVHEMVLMGRTASLGNFNSPTIEDEDIALKALAEVGMTEFKDRNFNSLSGGEAQMVKLARSIAQNTQVLVLDEPTAHLDFRNELKVIKQISNMAKDRGIAVLMATHFPNHAFFFENEGNSTKVGLMNNGKIEIMGSASEVLTEQNMDEIFKIKAKVYNNEFEGRKNSYIMPLDLID